MTSKGNSRVSSTCWKRMFTLFKDTTTLLWIVDVVIPLLVLWMCTIILSRMSTMSKTLLLTVRVIILAETNL
jgi:hypothetical protein